MSERTPPLTALRAFEAAARHLSFAAAAAELNVTPAALSFQIKSLEERLGAPLFLRMNRAVALTPIGKSLAPETTRGFETLNRAWNAARGALNSNRLTVTAGPAFTGKWLAPRLGDFMRAHPEIELHLSASFAVADFSRDDVDIAVRFGAQREEDDFCEPLIGEWITPIARPDIAARIKRPADLLDHALVHDEGFTRIERGATWGNWFARVGLTEIDLPRGIAVSQSDHALDYIIQNGGVALGRIVISAESLRTGALVAPFHMALPCISGFRIVCGAGQEERPTIAAFRAWLKSQAARDAAMTQEIVAPP